MVACEEAQQKMRADEEEIRLILSNIEYAYKCGMLNMSDAIRLIKNAYGVNDVPKHTHSIG